MENGLDEICKGENLSSWRRCLSHMSANVAKAIARYSALTLDLPTTSLFLTLPGY